LIIIHVIIHVFLHVFRGFEFFICNQIVHHLFHDYPQLVARHVVEMTFGAGTRGD